MDPIEQQVIQAYMNAFGRRPMQSGLDFYTSVLRQNPNFDLVGELQGSPEYGARQAYQEVLGRDPGMEAVQNFINSGTTVEQLRSQLQASPEYATRQATLSANSSGIAGIDLGGTNSSGAGPSGIGFGGTNANTNANGGGVNSPYVPPTNNTPIDTAGNSNVNNSASNTDYDQIVQDLYQEEFGREARQEALDAYSNALESGYFTPETLRSELQASPEAGFRQLYMDVLGREPELEAVDNFLDSGQTLDEIRPQLVASAENRTNVEQLSDLGGADGIPLNTSGDLASIADLAYNLATGTNLDFPEYQVADLSGEQQQAIAEFNQNRGVYQPFLDQGSSSTMQGIGAMGEALGGTRDAQQYITSTTLQGMADQGQALGGTRDLTSQIPGQIAPGQQALGLAATDVQRFAGQGAESADIASQRARASTEEAQRALQEAAGFGQRSAEQGIAGLQGSSEMYTPDMIRPFMSDYEDAAVQQALSDLARQGELRERDLEAQAVQAGAFGGSRQAVAEQELARNVMEQQGRTAAEMRNTGYQSAAQRSQQAFEDAMRRRQSEGQITGQLGQIGSGAAADAAESAGRLGLDAEQLAQTGGLNSAQMQMSGANQAGNLGLAGANLGLSGIQAGLAAQQQASGIGLTSANLGLSGIQQGLNAQNQAANIGQGIAGLGQQYANMGGQAQQYQMQDLSTLMQMGQMGQGQAQAQLDAQRLNQYQNMMVPFQQLAFASDIMTGTPTGITSVMSQPIQGPSAFSQIAGLGLSAASLFL